MMNVEVFANVNCARVFFCTDIPDGCPYPHACDVGHPQGAPTLAVKNPKTRNPRGCRARPGHNEG